jgi:hypothetical protein
VRLNVYLFFFGFVVLEFLLGYRVSRPLHSGLSLSAIDMCIVGDVFIWISLSQNPLKPNICVKAALKRFVCLSLPVSWRHVQVTTVSTLWEFSTSAAPSMTLNGCRAGKNLN